MEDKTTKPVETVKADEHEGKYPVKEKPIKPITVRIEDFKENLNKVVAESELPPFLSVMILREMLMGMNPIAEKEYALDRETWEKECRKYEEWLKTQEKGKKEGEKDG